MAMLINSFMIHLVIFWTLVAARRRELNIRLSRGLLQADSGIGFRRSAGPAWIPAGMAVRPSATTSVTVSAHADGARQSTGLLSTPAKAFSSMWLHSRARLPAMELQHDEAKKSNKFPIDFKSEEWKALQMRMDELPMFMIVDNEAKPALKMQENGIPAYIFNLGVEEANEELKKAQKENPGLELRLMTVGLGEAYKQASFNSGVLVPGIRALTRVGDDWDNATLPAYVCFGMKANTTLQGVKKAPSAELSESTPVFLDPLDAQANIDAVKERAKSSPEGLTAELETRLELSVAPIDTIVEIILSGKEEEMCGDRFFFSAPGLTTKFLQEAMQELNKRQMQFQAGSGVQTPAPTPPFGLFPE